ncbi:hypothetical protein [Sporocytophaga myxococcoides]|uniref:hypothetical protein n=1 Tax=Sporocytophaga myxococcoides TaxID=153721 RepID=UPI0004042C3D|nr:hypothetical protein [Sporocytophaga myxococcoides]
MEKALKVLRLIFFSLLACVLVIPSLYAQRDTVVVYDTIIEVKDPVVIRHEYYSSSDKQLNRIRLNKIYCGTGYSRDSYKDKNVENSNSRFASIGGSIWLSKVFFAELGINYLLGKTKVHSTESNRYTKEINFIEYDTIGSYIHTVDGVSTEIPIVDEISRTRTDTLVSIDHVAYNKQVKSISIPISFGYIYSKNRFYCGLLVQLAPIFLSVSKEGDGKEIHERQIRLGTGTEFGFKLTNAFAVSARYMLQNHYQYKISDKDLSVTQHQVSLLLNYFF